MMSDDIGIMRAELECLGYSTAIRDSAQGKVVEFDYLVETGRNRGKPFRVGISMLEAGYPEYPPHWIHASPPVDDGLGGSVKRYRTGDGREWAALSRPPGQLWEQLPAKNMKHYLDHQLRRFWSRI